MKTIGLIGGTSFKSTLTYYQVINETVNDILGGSHSAKCILYSVNFHDIESNIISSNWDNISDILIKAAKTLEQANVDFIILCTNTLHKVVPNILNEINIPILHIADLTADTLIQNSIQNVGLLGTKATMELDFYKEKLASKGINVLIPSKKDIEIVNSIIFDELCHGIIKEESKKEYLRIIDDLNKKGAKGIILGCTEIGLLINQLDTPIPLFDTTFIHAKNAAKFSLSIQ